MPIVAAACWLARQCPPYTLVKPRSSSGERQSRWCAVQGGFPTWAQTAWAPTHGGVCGAVACGGSRAVARWGGGVWGVAGCAGLPPPLPIPPTPPHTHTHSWTWLTWERAGTQNTATCLCSRMSTPATAGCGRCLARMPSSLPATSVPANGKPVGAAAPELGTRVWYCDGY